MKTIKMLNPVLIVRDYLNLRKRMLVLENRVRELELEKDPLSLWLFRNKTERMDATRRDIFDPLRADFHLERYRFSTSYANECKVVDAACGTGYGSELLKTSGRAIEVCGVDIDKEAIDYAQVKHSQVGVKFIACSATDIPLPDGWADLVTSFETIEHVPHDKPLLDEFARLLKPGGLLIISTPNNWPLELAPYHRRVYTRLSFEESLRDHFEIIKMYNQNSGGNSAFNHGQPAGLVQTTNDNERFAECYVAVCKKK